MLKPFINLLKIKINKTQSADAVEVPKPPRDDDNRVMDYPTKITR